MTRLPRGIGPDNTARALERGLSTASTAFLEVLSYPSSTVTSMPGTLSSLELVLDLIQREREKQRAHFDALDNKAGLAVGFAALLITLVPDLGIPYSLLVVLAALCAGGFGLASFWPRRYPVLSARRLRAYVAAEQQLTRKVVVDTLVEVNDETAAMLSTKGLRLRWALIFLGITALMLAVGILVTASEGGSS